MHTKQKWTEQDNIFLIENFSKLGMKECARILNRHPNMICNYARKRGITVNKEHMRQRLRTAIEKRMSINLFQSLNDLLQTPEFAYILGYLWADGWIINKKVTSVHIKLIKKDMDLIRHIFQKIGNWKSYIITSTKNHGEELRMSHKGFVNFLVDHNYKIKSGASAQKILDKIPDHLKHYWWRGYIDGDGYIRANNQIQIKITSVIHQDWSFLPHEFNFSTKQLIAKNGNCSIAVIRKQKYIYKFLNYIYNCAEEDRIFLPRKFESAKILLNKYKNQFEDV